VGVGERAADEFNFAGKLAALQEELLLLNEGSRRLEAIIESNARDLLAGISQ
jgi:hypothetical protein